MKKMMNNFKIKFFKSRDKANYYKRKYDGEVYHYSARSRTKEYYIQELKLIEGYFDEAFAAMYPYCLVYLDKEEAPN